MSDIAQIVVAVFGFLTTCVMSARYLFGYWFKQQKEVRILEKKVYEQAIDNLKAESTSLKDTIRSHAYRIQEFEVKLSQVVKQFASNQEQGQLVLESLKSFVDQTGIKFADQGKKIEELGQRQREQQGQILSIGKDVRLFKEIKKS